MDAKIAYPTPPRIVLTLSISEARDLKEVLAGMPACLGTRVFHPLRVALEAIDAMERHS